MQLIILPSCSADTKYQSSCNFWFLLIFYFIFSAYSTKSPKPQKPKEKQNRVWDNAGSSTKELDYSDKNGAASPGDDEKNLETQTGPVRTGRLLLNLERFSWCRIHCNIYINEEEVKGLVCVSGNAGKLHER